MKYVVCHINCLVRARIGWLTWRTAGNCVRDLFSVAASVLEIGNNLESVDKRSINLRRKHSKGKSELFSGVHLSCGAVASKKPFQRCHVENFTDADLLEVRRDTVSSCTDVSSIVTNVQMPSMFKVILYHMLLFYPDWLREGKLPL
jgi:hypothetical protein